MGEIGQMDEAVLRAPVGSQDHAGHCACWWCATKYGGVRPAFRTPTPPAEEEQK